VPGSLARVTALVAEAGANVQEIHHQRAFTLLAAQNVEIEMVLQTRGQDALVEARVLRAGKSLAFGEIDLRGARDGQSVCRASTTYALL
jgi:threonine dehydratase